MIWFTLFIEHHYWVCVWVTYRRRLSMWPLHWLSEIIIDLGIYGEIEIKKQLYYNNFWEVSYSTYKYIIIYILVDEQLELSFSAETRFLLQFFIDLKIQVFFLSLYFKFCFLWLCLACNFFHFLFKETHILIFCVFLMFSSLCISTIL